MSVYLCACVCVGTTDRGVHLLVVLSLHLLQTRVRVLEQILDVLGVLFVQLKLLLLKASHTPVQL